MISGYAKRRKRNRRKKKTHQPPPVEQLYAPSLHEIPPALTRNMYRATSPHTVASTKRIAQQNVLGKSPVFGNSGYIASPLTSSPKCLVSSLRYRFEGFQRQDPPRVNQIARRGHFSPSVICDGVNPFNGVRSRGIIGINAASGSRTAVNYVQHLMPPAEVSREALVVRKDGDDDDVKYLYSVDTSSDGKVVEEIDLSKDSPAGVCRKKPPSVAPPTTNNKPVTRSDSKALTSKRKLGDGPEEPAYKRRNTSSQEPSCCNCCRPYSDILKQNGFLTIAKCSHLFCSFCVTPQLGLGVKNCCRCMTQVDRLRKIYM